MNVGTKSLLFGVHQFFWHPITVVRAFKRVHGFWPTFDELICIIVHDWGYWGSPNMDGEQGRRHPERGAKIAAWLVYRWHRLQGHHRLVARMYAAGAFDRAIAHSSHYAKLRGLKPSMLYLPDKVSILFEPRWFYLLRAKLSGEVYEYIANSPFSRLSPELQTPGAWFNWYKTRVKLKLEQYEKNNPCGTPCTRIYNIRKSSNKC